ncbi:hypothetical protein EYF80_052067 [Liparis tanakae]|uniref:Uncharacterized protein n=1 Tax=Liparis tanakae TaxID=230148 RepID=A0A4Z2F961_9TELE|nr:hypothetical protein EYF80_052067 [Liparis tanakae]
MLMWPSVKRRRHIGAQSKDGRDFGQTGSRLHREPGNPREKLNEPHPALSNNLLCATQQRGHPGVENTVYQRSDLLHRADDSQDNYSRSNRLEMAPPSERIIWSHCGMHGNIPGSGPTDVTTTAA